MLISCVEKLKRWNKTDREIICDFFNYIDAVKIVKYNNVTQKMSKNMIFHQITINGRNQIIITEGKVKKGKRQFAHYSLCFIFFV